MNVDSSIGTLAAFCTASLLASLLPAQRPADGRIPAFVEVVNADGAPSVGAEVCACHRSRDAWHGDADDEVQAIADHRGIAVLRLLPGDYSFHAVAAAAGGTAAVSVVEEHLRGGGRRTLRLGPPRARQQVVVDGLAAWSKLGPLRVLVAAHAHNVQWREVPQEVAPSMPGIDLVMVVDRTGAPLWGTNCSSRSPLTVDGNTSSEAPPPIRLGIPVPQPLTVRAVQDGKPVAGVEIVRSFPIASSNRWSDQMRLLPTPAPRAVLGRTDERGELQLLVAWQNAFAAIKSSSGYLDLQLDAIGADGLWGFSGINQLGQVISGESAIPVPADHVLPFAMTAPTTLLVVPPVTAEVTLFGKCANAAWKSLRDEGPMRLRVGDDGVASMPWPRSDTPMRVARIEVEGKAPAWAIVEPSEDRHLVDVAATTTTIEVRDAAGMPATNTRLVLWPHHPLRAGVQIEVPLLVDAVGRAKVRIGRGRWVLAAIDGQKHALHFFEDGERPANVALQLAPAIPGTLEFRDAKGQPCAGRSVYLAALSYRTSAHWRTAFLGDLQQEWLGGAVQRFECDEKGCLRLPMLEAPGLSAVVLVRTEPRFDQPPLEELRLRSGETVEITLP